MSRNTHSITGTAVAVCLLAALLAGAVPGARAQTVAECRNSPTPERYGPTDISATTGNQRLSVALNPDATVTVFKWPSPSYYDQIKYKTTDRSLARMGALPNEGAFIGLGYRPDPRNKGSRWGFSWLRQWRSSQRFATADGDEVVTTFRSRKLGLQVTVRDLVAPAAEALLRRVKVRRNPSSPVRTVRVFAFANFNPVFSKDRGQPFGDWCDESDNDGGAEYVSSRDLILHERAGMDASTGLSSSVALGIGFMGTSEGHHVGSDTYESAQLGTSAYDDATDGKLGGADSASGQADATLYDQLRLGSDRKAATTILMGAAPNRPELVGLFKRLRTGSYGSTRKEKSVWWRLWLRKAAIPRTAPRPVVQLAKRSLIVMRQAADPGGGLVVSSIATQSPLGLDWVRDGAYVDRALMRAGHPELAGAHVNRYASLQARPAGSPPGGEVTPIGNWAENFYADGVVGGTTAYEIDSTGLGIWALWDYIASTGSDELLDTHVYEAIQRAAHYLTDDPPLGCRDPATGLHCPAAEEGSESPQRTLIGAQAAWLGLDAATKAATARGTEGSLVNVQKWKARREELRAAIRSAYFDADCSCYTSDPGTGGAFLWPVGMVPYSSKVAAGQAEQNWRYVRRSMRGRNDRGGEETRALLGNAFVWHDDSDGARRLRRGLRWIATVPTTPGTGLLGRAWMLYPGEKGSITAMDSQPHVPTHAMFYLAALKTFGAERWRR